MSTLRSAITRLSLLGVLLVVRPALGDEVDRRFAQGTAALKAGKYTDAVQAFALVWKERRTHDVAANLALAESKAGRHRDAAEHFAFALRSFPVTGDPATKKGIESAFAEAKSHVMTVKVVVNVDGAEVTLDGAVLGRSPLADEVFVEPGPRTVQARLTRFSTATKTVEAIEGGSDTVRLDLSPEPAASTTASATTAAPAVRSKVPALVMGGVGIAALAVGGGLLGGYAGKRDEVSSTFQSILDAKGSCVPGAANFDARCEDVESAARAGDDLNRAGIGFLIGGGVLAAAAIGYWLWPDGTSKRTSVRVVPVADDRHGGLVVSGAW